MNRCILKVKGKNIKNFLIKIDRNKIKVLNIKNITDSEIEILIYKKDISLIDEIKGIYEYELIKEIGYGEIRKIIKKNVHLLLLLIINIILLNFISNYIYKVEIIENNQELKKFINKILEQKGIKEYNLKPKNLEKLKKEILLENKDSIEWIEIIPSGVKYIVKVEERIKSEKVLENEPSNIIAKKNGIIKKIIASNGKILKEKESTVKKGDILITGIIDEDKKVHAKGSVFAEVWYKITVSESLHDNIYELTGKKKNGFKIGFFNYNFELYKKYEYNDITENKIFKNDILPFYLSYDTVNELNIIDHILTIEEATNKAIEKGKKELQKKLGKDESIISENQLKISVKDSKIIVDILFTTYENISEEERIEVDNVQGDFRNSNQ